MVIQIKATEQFFPMMKFKMLYQVVLSLWIDVYSNCSYFVLQLRCLEKHIYFHIQLATDCDTRQVMKTSSNISLKK